MSLFISSLNSGSNGNCYYVGNDTEAILIDAGISCNEIIRRIKRLGLAVENVKAIFISHEHTDHISGVKMLSKCLKIPVYITDTTLKFSGLKLDSNFLKTLTTTEPVTVGSLNITAFPKFHDASDPYSFMVSYNNINVGVFTDIGRPCEKVKKYFSECHAAFLESNYDEEMLVKGSYPWFLKNRIRSGNGHLSNKQALDLFLTHRPKHMSHLLLSHLSKNNNCPKLVQETFDKHANGVKIIVAGRYEETALYKINPPVEFASTTKKPIRASQLSFDFF